MAPGIRVPKAPPPSSRGVSAVMRGNIGRNTRPEVAVRRLLWRLGYRYRLHGALPGRPDICFPGRRKLIFVHGCFWHQHPSVRCKLRKHPRTNLDYWRAKLSNNTRRDALILRDLAELGWNTLTVWECETTKDKHLLKRLKSFLGPVSLTRSGRARVGMTRSARAV